MTQRLSQVLLGIVMVGGLWLAVAMNKQPARAEPTGPPPEIGAPAPAFSGLRVVAVSGNGSESSLRRMAATRGLSFEILRDDRESTEAAYAVVGYPRTYIIDRDGVLRGMRIGYGESSYGKNVALVRRLLSE